MDARIKKFVTGGFPEKVLTGVDLRVLSLFAGFMPPRHTPQRSLPQDWKIGCGVSAKRPDNGV